jgi:hypothetical protein
MKPYLKDNLLLLLSPILGIIAILINFRKDSIIHWILLGGCTIIIIAAIINIIKKRVKPF